MLPTLKQDLKPGDIVVMDNTRSHHVKAVRKVLEEKGMQVLYLPPYSPDLNPIKKMKALLRGWKVQSLDLLPDAVRMALASVSQLEDSVRVINPLLAESMSVAQARSRFRTD